MTFELRRNKLYFVVVCLFVCLFTCNLNLLVWRVGLDQSTVMDSQVVFLEQSFPNQQ